MTDPGESALVTASGYTKLSGPMIFKVSLVEVENDRWMHFGTLCSKVA